MKIKSLVSVKAQWSSFTYPVLKGTPISKLGAVANNGSAVGIAPETIEKAPDYPSMPLYIMTEGSADIAELPYQLNASAIQAMNGIVFFGTDMTPSADPLYSVPSATATKVGGVKKAAAVAEAAGETVTAAEFKALLDSLKAAGIMAAS